MGYDTSSRWSLEPKTPKISGKVVVLADSRAISSAETFLSFIEHYQLAEIVGSPSAGANGIINPFLTLGGIRIHWTGMKVLKNDGSQHHLVGIQPTVPVHRHHTGH